MRSDRLCVAAGLLVGSAVMATPASAAWVVVDNFQSYTAGDTISGKSGWTVSTADNVSSTSPTVAIDPADSANRAYRQGAGGNTAGEDIFTYGGAGTIAIGNNTTGTIFFRLKLAGTGTANISLGSSTASSAVNFANFQTQFRVLGSSSYTMDVRDSGAFETVTSASTLSTGGWYNFWMVVNNQADTTQIYVQRDGDANFNTQTLLTSTGGDPIGFRTTTSSTIANLLVGVASNPLHTLSDFYIDDIHVDNAASNLANPVPEPSLLAGASLGFALLLRRRRRGTSPCASASTATAAECVRANGSLRR